MTEKNEKRARAAATFLVRAVPNVCIIISVMLIVFLIINAVNDAMNFINNEITLTLLFILAVCTVFTSVLAIYYQRKIFQARIMMRRMKKYIDANIHGGDGDEIG